MPDFRPEHSRRILLYLPWEPDLLGGVDVVVDRLQRAINSTYPGMALVGVQYWRSKPGISRAADGTEVLRLNLPAPPQRGFLAWLRYALSLGRRLPALRRVLAEQRITVINAHYPTPNLYAVAWLKRLRLWDGHVVLSFHGSDINAVDLADRIWKAIAAQVDASTACSIALTTRVIEKAGNALGQVHTIHNGLDTVEFLGRATMEAPFSELVGRRYLLNIGIFVPRKGQDLLLRAFASICTSHSDVMLVLAGGRDNGLWLEEMRALARDLGISGRVHFMVDVPHHRVPILMKHALCLVLPSRGEGFPLVLLEAGALCIPIVASSVGGIPELVDSEGLGILVAPGSLDELADALTHILLHPEEAQLLGNCLHARVERLYTSSAMAAKFLAAYHD